MSQPSIPAFPQIPNIPQETFGYDDPQMGGLILTSDDQNQDTAYSQYPIDTNYTWDEGLHVMPVAGPPGTPARVMRLHAGLNLKRVQWSAERIGMQLTCPSWDLTNDNEIC